MSTGTYTITIVKQYDLYRHRIFCTSGHLLARSLWRLATAASFRRVFIKLPRRLNKLSSKKAVALCFSKLPSPSSPSCHEKAVALCFSKLPKPSSTSCHKKAAEPFFNKLSSKKLSPSALSISRDSFALWIYMLYVPACTTTNTSVNINFPHSPLLPGLSVISWHSPENNSAPSYLCFFRERTWKK